MSAERPKHQPEFEFDYPQGEVLSPKRASKLAAEFLMMRYFTELSVKGSYYLEQAYTLLDDNNAIIFAGNHESNADGPIVHKAITQAPISKQKDMTPVFPIGRRLTENEDRRIRFLTRSVPTIPVWPPTVAVARNARSEFSAINNNAQDVSEKVLKSDDQSLVLFPEGTRTRTGELNEGIKAIGRYFTLAQNAEESTGIPPKNDTAIVPFIIDGAAEVFPVSSNLPHEKGPVSVQFLEPLKVSELLDRYADLPKTHKQQAMVDHVMIKIAQHLPEEQRGYYQDKIGL